MKFRQRQVADPRAQQNFEQLEGVLPTRVTALPAQPADEQEIYYVANATTGVAWHLKYRAASTSAYKWEFVGGGTLSDEQPTAGTGSGGYAAATNAGPTITVPLAGDYLVAVGCTAFNSTVPIEVRMSYDTGATVAVDADAVVFGHDVASSRKPMHGRPRRKLALAANTALVAKYKSGGGTWTVEDRWMTAVPLRVG